MGLSNRTNVIKEGGLTCAHVDPQQKHVAGCHAPGAWQSNAPAVEGTAPS
jgi:hypothetical protein